MEENIGYLYPAEIKKEIDYSELNDVRNYR